MTVELRVPDATCGHCKSTIESAIIEVDDVDKVELDLETKRLTVEGSSALDIQRITGAIEGAGYTAEQLP